MPNNLRSSVIRLAHANPELRSHLLPLLKVASAKVRVQDVQVNRKGAFVIAFVEVSTSEVPSEGDISKGLTQKYGDELVPPAVLKIEPNELKAAGYDFGDVEPEYGLASSGRAAPVWTVAADKRATTVFHVSYLIGLS